MTNTVGKHEIKTPDLFHLSSSDFEKVYEPREDSFLFLDAIEKDLSIIHSLKPLLCLEVGSGSGVVSTAVAKTLGSSCFMMATDLNPFACQFSHQTAEVNKTHVDCIQMDLCSMLTMNKSVDLLLFNPPYVVTSSEELNQPKEDGSFLHLAWAGGIKGREVTDRLLGCVGQVLSERSLFYLVVIEENDPEEIFELMYRQRFIAETVVSRKVRNEHLSVIRFCRGLQD